MKRCSFGAVILLIAALVTISGAVVAQLPTPTREFWDVWQPGVLTLLSPAATYANLRDWPSTATGKIIGQVRPGAIEVSNDQPIIGWQRVRFNGQVGWVSETVATVTVIVTIMPTATPTRAASATPSATWTPAAPTATATVNAVARALELLAQAEALEVQAAQLRAQAVGILRGGG